MMSKQKCLSISLSYRFHRNYILDLSFFLPYISCKPHWSKATFDFPALYSCLRKSRPFKLRRVNVGQIWHFVSAETKEGGVNRFMDSQEHTSIPTISSLSPRPDREIKGVPIQKLPKAGSGDDKLMSNIIGWLLQGGVVVSSAIILIGLILLLLSPEGLANTGITAFPHSLGSVWIGL
jgi:hypothetical protein